MKTGLIILAAGKGTRMNSELPKVLHPIAGEPMLVHAMASGAVLAPDCTVIVAGHGAAQVEAAALEYDPDVTVVTKDEQLGLGYSLD